ncbi:DUF6444 domain-containing protein [Vibrio metschnikovii]|uniref:DUF6444 domain-containing protein n=1 Tax=Vibrio metschnikovii TaxID=28172 RepID=UPI00315CE203
MNKKTLPPPPDFDSPEEAKEIIHFLWHKLAELEDRLNQNSRNSSVPSSQRPLHNKAKNTSPNRKKSGKSKELNQVIKAIADCFTLLKTVPRLSNTYRIRYATMVGVLFQIENLINDTKFSIYPISLTHLLSLKSLKASAHGVVINIKRSFQSMCPMFK